MTPAGDLLLSDLLPLAQPTEYKLHFARRDKTRPLDDYLEGWDRWVGWQQYWPGRNDFNRPFIFSLMDFHPEPDIWLFGGIFQVLGLCDKRYEVALMDHAAALIGRLKVRYPYKTRMTRPYLEGHYDGMVVSELLPRPYAGRVFPGYNELDLSFSELETIVRTSRPDWKQALELIKGVYLITDALAEKRYVGSAYGTAGIWSRWSAYAWTGHGGNVELRPLVLNDDLAYCRENLRITLLEHHVSTVSDETILAREVFWKTALRSRGLTGMNRN
jgi:hypothetical protein